MLCLPVELYHQYPSLILLHILNSPGLCAERERRWIDEWRGGDLVLLDQSQTAPRGSPPPGGKGWRRSLASLAAQSRVEGQRPPRQQGTNTEGRPAQPPQSRAINSSSKDFWQRQMQVLVQFKCINTKVKVSSTFTFRQKLDSDVID